jgi:pyruvate/2-oxoglutarate dehydrogenase complex dihydrolipoamide acyltransferase (E2) component
LVLRLSCGVLTNVITQAKDGERGLPVGKVIALLVEEGDDISNLELPKEEEAIPTEPTKPVEPEKKLDAPPSSALASPNPTKSSHVHIDGPVFPSVMRLLNQAGIENYKKIKGTGVRGMLTKGDVLAYMGKASSPTGTYKKTAVSAALQAAATPPKKEVKVLSHHCLESTIHDLMAALARRRSRFANDDRIRAH